MTPEERELYRRFGSVLEALRARQDADPGCWIEWPDLGICRMYEKARVAGLVEGHPARFDAWKLTDQGRALLLAAREYADARKARKEQVL